MPLASANGTQSISLCKGFSPIIFLLNHSDCLILLCLVINKLSMSYIRIWVHCVWATKERVPYLIDNIRDKVIFHIIENARSKQIFVDHLNGYLQHLHALISMGGKQNISDIMQLIKGESSHWIIYL